jgi:hypothetical protein
MVDEWGDEGEMLTKQMSLKQFSKDFSQNSINFFDSVIK